MDMKSLTRKYLSLAIFAAAMHNMFANTVVVSLAFINTSYDLWFWWFALYAIPFMLSVATTIWCRKWIVRSFAKLDFGVVVSAIFVLLSFLRIQSLSVEESNVFHDDSLVQKQEWRRLTERFGLSETANNNKCVSQGKCTIR